MELMRIVRWQTNLENRVAYESLCARFDNENGLSRSRGVKDSKGDMNSIKALSIYNAYQWVHSNALSILTD